MHYIEKANIFFGIVRVNRKMLISYFPFSKADKEKLVDKAPVLEDKAEVLTEEVPKLAVEVAAAKELTEV